MKNPTTIVHIVLRFDIGGLEKVLIDTVNQLSDGFEHIVVSLTTANPVSIRMLQSNVKVIELNRKKANDIKQFWKIFKLLRENNPTVLHTYNLPTLEFQICGFLARVPKRIHAEHGRNADDPHGMKKKNLLFRRLLSPVVNVWVAVSNDISDWLETRVGIPVDRIRTIYNGVDTEYFSSHNVDKKSTARLEGFASGEDFVVGTIGRLDPVKNQQILFKAFELIRSKHPSMAENIKIAIVGSGELYQSFKKQIISGQLSGEIWLPGSRNNIREILAEFDVFVLPSIAEGVPVTLLEAMSMECPVVASAVGGIPEVIDASCGNLLQAKDLDGLVETIVKIYVDPEHSRTNSVNGRKKIEKYFSQSRMVDQYRDLYI